MSVMSESEFFLNVTKCLLLTVCYNFVCIADKYICLDRYMLRDSTIGTFRGAV